MAKDPHKKTRFGLLGTGFWADYCHAAGLAAHPDVEFVGIWGRDPAKAAEIAERHAAAAEADLDDLLAAVDAVAIAVAPSAQAELAVRAADSRCHILLEKPLALSAEDADAVVTAVKRAGVQTNMFFTFRFMPPAAAWLDEVSDGEWHGGSVTFLTSEFPPTDAPPDLPPRGQNVTLWGAAPHPLALLLMALGPVRSVAGIPGDGRTTNVVLEHISGAVSSVTISLAVAGSSEDFTFEFQLWGASGKSRYPELGDISDAYAAALTELIGAIDGSGPASCDIGFAAEINKVLTALEQSFSSGMRMALDEG